MNRLSVGAMVSPVRENVLARSADWDFIYVHPEHSFPVVAFDNESAIVQHPDHGLVSILRADLKGGGE